MEKTWMCGCGLGLSALAADRLATMRRKMYTASVSLTGAAGFGSRIGVKGSPMLRRIIHIDEEKCNGCGLCATACHEGAIDIVDGKARLMREDFCDGLGDCLPSCPMDAISFVEREAPAYNEAAVMAAQVAKAMGEAKSAGCPTGGCPGSAAMDLRAADSPAPKQAVAAAAAPVPAPAAGCPGSQAASLRGQEAAAANAAADGSASVPAAPAPVSQLAQWPCQIKLVPVNAPFFQGAKLLIAADCTAYAYANFHQEFMAGRVTLIGCPKLDAVDYSEKLTDIIANNNIESVEVLRMDVPCCSGIENATIKALQNSGKFIPWSVITIGRDGKILDRRP